MLRAITLEGFRCFDDPQQLRLSGLTVFAGANNVGKSSVVHALTALVQSEEQQSRELLRLAGPWVDLGSFRQTLNSARSGQERYFRIGLNTLVAGIERDVVWTFDDPGDSSSDAARLKRVEALVADTEFEIKLEDDARTYGWSEGGDSTDGGMKSGRAELPHPGRARLYLDATRNLDRELQLLPYGPENVLYLGPHRSPAPRLHPPRRNFVGPLLGITGEYTAETLLDRERTSWDVLPKHTVAGVPLVLALNAWWRHIFEGDYTLKPERVEGLGTRLLLDTPTAENLSLGQVGTGLSQALPIVTLGLCSAPGQLVIIESPEIHLHPAAQHRLCDLFVALVRSGRQVIVETHSDHLVNAIRIAVKNGAAREGLASDQVSINFFSQKDGRTTIDPIPIDESGRLERWPVGFFDQTAQSLLELMK